MTRVRFTVTMDARDSSSRTPHEGGIPWAWVKAVNDALTAEPWEEPPLPVEVLPWLYLSDQWSLDVRSLSDLGVAHVLSVNRMPSRELALLRRGLESEGIAHHWVAGEDEEGYDMIGKHWSECRDFLRSVRGRNDGRVVVHCIQGQNRSALIVSSALVTLERMTLLNAVQMIKAKRGLVLTNLSFQKQLCLLAANEGLLGHKPADYTDDPVPERERLPSVQSMFGGLDKLAS